jgi:hypothetical protein
MLAKPHPREGTVEFIPSPTAVPVPVPGEAVGSAWNLAFLIILGVAVLATVVLFLWSNRERS